MPPKKKAFPYWNVQKKVDSVSTPSGMLRYGYDPQGNRLSKSLAAADTTYYIRDAAGNVMAIYLAKSGELRLKERHVYGASRLGVRYSDFGLATAQNPDSLRIFADTVGAKTYEFSNHLGNVLVTLSDKKMLTGAHYSAIVGQAGFYYPFGWEIPTLQYSSGYRYGFNGKENDSETKTTDFGARFYGSREARWWTVDPSKRLYPNQNPYNFALNSPIHLLDNNGKYVVDGDGNIVFVPIEKPTFIVQGSRSGNKFQSINAAISGLNKIGASEIADVYGYNAQRGYIFADDGKRIEVYLVTDKNTYNAQIKYTYEKLDTDSEADIYSRPPVLDLDNPRVNNVASPNCAGDCMLAGKFVLFTDVGGKSTPAMGLLKGDNYTMGITSPKAGDIGLYFKNHETSYGKERLEHVEGYESEHTVHTKGGITIKKTGQVPGKTWDNPFDRYEIARKTTPNRIVPFSAGVVSEGVKSLDKKQAKAFEKLLKKQLKSEK